MLKDLLRELNWFEETEKQNREGLGSISKEELIAVYFISCYFTDVNQERLGILLEML